MGLLVLAAPARAQAPAYTIEVLPGWAAAINDSNLIAMSRPHGSAKSVAGLYNATTSQFTALTIPMSEARVTDIADSGWATGCVRPTGGLLTVVAWSPSLSRATIRSTTSSVILGPYVNSSGRVAWGEYSIGAPGQSGFAWAPGSRIANNSALNSMGRGVNAVSSQGWILGTVVSESRAAYMSAAGASYAVPLPPTATRSEGTDANAVGQFLIASFHSGQSPNMRSYVWSRSSGTYRELRNPLSGRFMQLPRAFNDIGDAVGAGASPMIPIPEPMLWIGDDGYTFRELLGGQYPPGWSGFLYANDINDNGIIVGEGTYMGARSAFMMKPVLPWHR